MNKMLPIITLEANLKIVDMASSGKVVKMKF